MQPQPLPIGLQTFRDIREGGFLYIDKTEHLYHLVHRIGAYFLSRPRRFGKSTLISTLEEIFLGNRELFHGLWIEQSDYSWHPYPVIRIDFNDYKPSVPLEKYLQKVVSDIAQEHDLTLPDDLDYGDQFKALIQQAAKQSPASKVVLLVDEYDKPLIEVLTETERAVAQQKILKGFYSVIKSVDAQLQFVFLTGVSKFSHVGVFSGLNHLTDLSRLPRYADLLGLTHDELKVSCEPHIHNLAEAYGLTFEQTLKKIRHYYNGYRFSLRDCQVYNPFSTLQVLEHQVFKYFWFETGTPTFLIQLIRSRNFDLTRLDQLELKESAFSAYDVEQLQLPALLFQTGYLTIQNYDSQFEFYRLGYPNLEVREAFTQNLLNSFFTPEHFFDQTPLHHMLRALQNADMDAFFQNLTTLFATIPYDIQIPLERYYQSIFYLTFTLIGVHIQAEIRTNRGRIDIVLETDSTTFLFEFKFDGTAQEAMDQIHQQGYAEKYQATQKSLLLIGANFDGKTRNVGEYLVERQRADL